MKPQADYVEADLSKALVEKWAPILDYSSPNVKALETDSERVNTAILLENQEKWCLQQEQNTVGGGVFGTAGAAQGGQYTGNFAQGVPAAGDANYAANDARLPKVLIPMIRRTFPELVTNEIVGVQPMTGPVGLAFALRYRYGGTNLGESSSGSDGNAIPLGS